MGRGSCETVKGILSGLRRYCHVRVAGRDAKQRQRERGGGQDGGNRPNEDANIMMGFNCIYIVDFEIWVGNRVPEPEPVYRCQCQRTIWQRLYSNPRAMGCRKPMKKIFSVKERKRRVRGRITCHNCSIRSQVVR